LRTHPARHLGDQPLDRVQPDHIERFIATMRRQGTKPKTINNAITLLGQVFDHGVRKGWCASNPVRQVDRPTIEQSNEIRFLDQAELEALLRSTDIPDRPHVVSGRRDDRPQAGRTSGAPLAGRGLDRRPHPGTSPSLPGRT